MPTPFWVRARVELDAIKPMFMLAEAAEPGLHSAAFDMTYDWELFEILKGNAAGRKTTAYRMTFTGNHDINSWNGSDTELFGAGFKACAVLAATWPGMPLIYNGQESVLDRRLAFFEKDAIDWKTHERAAFYAELLRLKHDNPALWNGEAGGSMTIVPTGNAAVFAFERRKGDNVVRVAINFSGGGVVELVLVDAVTTAAARTRASARARATCAALRTA